MDCSTIKEGDRDTLEKMNEFLSFQRCQSVEIKIVAQEDKSSESFFLFWMLVISQLSRGEIMKLALSMGAMRMSQTCLALGQFLKIWMESSTCVLHLGQKGLLVRHLEVRNLLDKILSCLTSQRNTFSFCGVLIFHIQLQWV